MNQTLNILVIGGGVAGMAAAQSFSGRDLIVHLVEKKTNLGGHAATWACMATDTCENCGACLSIEAADQIIKQKNVILHLNTMVKKIKKSPLGYEIILEDKETFNVKKIIMATGFSPFNPDQTQSLHYDDHENLITTAELNTLLKEEKLEDCFKGKPDPKIAFIQCVGSRNRDQGRDYCSQVCCKISIRHAKKLTHLFPEALITLFHMDLQIIGKETRSLFNTLSNNITLKQGVPAEILKNNETEMLTIITEDKDTQSRVAKAFDLIVLSVGMLPDSTLGASSDLLGLEPNSWGFFDTDMAVLPEDVVIAGCANGPKDILSSRREGRKAAAKIIDDLGTCENKKMNIAVFGQGAQADHTAMVLISKGYPVFLFGPGNSLSKDTPATIVDSADIFSISGTAGNFSIFYKSGKKQQSIICAAIVAAYEPEQELKLPQNLTNTILSLDAFSKLIKEAPKNCPDNIAILLDYNGPEFKSSARIALDTAIMTRSLGKNISILMNKMLVHGAMGQRLYDTARKKGIHFLRFDTCKDLDIRDSKNGFSIRLKEATLPFVELDLNCDCLVLPKNLIPARGFENAGVLLRQPLDREGFLQSANTRHRLTQSPRKGIFFAGTCHDEVDMDDLDEEINDILSALSTESFDLPKIDAGVEINQTTCAQCLTCIRICPHSAIVMNKDSKPQIVPDSCFSCHLCVSNCPAYAIESKELTNALITEKVKKGKVAVLACKRSSFLAADSLPLPDNINLIPVPCACRMSSDIILKALLAGASKVIVSGCHQENCRSIKGSSTAEVSVKNVLNFPGIDTSKVTWEPIAANENKKFQRILSKT